MKLLARLAERWRLLAFLVTLTLLPAAAAEVASQGPPTSADQDCPAPKREGVLRQEQAAVLGRLGPLAELRGEEDVEALAEAGFPFLAHQYTSFEGIGLTVFNPAAPGQRGGPNFLFYAPAEDAKDTTDPEGPDFPYTLAGWGYGVPYAPDHIPSFFPCMGVEDWHIHERGVHPLRSGGMTVMPPAETSFGASAGALADPPAMRPVVGFPHPRSWTIHLWRDESGVPKSGILDPDDPPSGIDPGVGSSFYFLDDPPKGLLDPFANSGRPLALQGGEGPQKKVAGGTYTLKVAAAQSGGELSMVEADLPSGSRRATKGAIDHDEGMFVLQGRITVDADGQTLPAGKDSFIYLPEGTDYSFEVDGSRARVLIVAVPGGLEQELGFEPPPGAPSAPPGGQSAGSGDEDEAARASLKPYVLQAGEGEEVAIRGSPYTFKAVAPDTGGRFSFMEVLLSEGDEPPPHIHHRETEAFYVLDGEMTFTTAGQTLPTQSGGVVLLPIGLPHQYTIDGDGQARLLLFAAPSGLEELFRALSKLGDRPPGVREALRTGVEPIVPPGVGGN